MNRLLHYLPDAFTCGIIASILLGLLLPCSGAVSVAFNLLTEAAIVLLFLLYGLRLSRRSVAEGLLHWRLQVMVLFFTFLFFPLMVTAYRPILEPLVGAGFFAGFLYVACLPSTVQSSITFTAVAGGNVPAAVCSAAVSSLAGVFLTPLLVASLFTVGASGSTSVGVGSIITISSRILLPFTLGQLAQTRLRDRLMRHKMLVDRSDQLTIWLVIYTSFSGATVQGYWQQTDVGHLLGLIATSLILLCTVQICIRFCCVLFHLNRPDSISTFFCGSKKSLAVGAPMMSAVFGATDTDLLLPLMVFHQVQLMICSQLAARWHRLGNTAPNDR